MDKKTSAITIAVVSITIALAGLITAAIFNTSFARSTVDYFSFFAAIFLVADGFYKIAQYKNEPYFPAQFLRHVRIIIGTCIFTIHVMQCIHGT